MRTIFNCFILLCISLLPGLASAQELSLSSEGKRPIAGLSKTTTAAGQVPMKCGFSYMLEKAKEKGYNEQAVEAEITRLIKKKRDEGYNFTGPVTVPVIFHVLYRNSDALGVSPNLSAAYLQAQLNQLNIDYANLAGSAYGVAADISIRFCMAVVDTAGRPLSSPGIERINAQGRGWSNTNIMNIDDLYNYFESTIKPQSVWDPYSYVNIWTAAMNNSGLLGYATFPGMSTLAGLDNTETNTTAGVVIAWQSVGSVAVPNPSGSPYDLGRTLTHELGHFFGLRHIWGDSNCGDDYCGDTPLHDDATFGCPTPGSLNNCTPSVPRMFENFMDYSNDLCMNTFTANQATRCQTVMDFSPRRLTLISSKACEARAGNAIGFSSAAPLTVVETGNAGACPNFKTYTFNVYVSSQATGNATVTFTGGGTATLNQDYTISPASVSYSAADNSAKTVTITVNDDQAAESSETIILGYTISGAGVVAGPDKQIKTITITDDDVASLTIDNTNPIKALVTEAFDASANIPAGWTTEVYGDGIPTPNAWVISSNGGAGTVNNSAHITDDLFGKPNTYNILNESDAYLFTPLIDATGLKDINLTFKWKSDGEVGYDAGFLGYIPFGETVTAANVRYFNVVLNDQATMIKSSLNFPASFANTKFYFVFNWYNDASVGSDPPFTIDSVSFTGKAFTIANSTDADTAFSQFSGQAVNFYSKNTGSIVHSRLIARVNNPSMDLGCITATVPIAGTGLTNLTTNTGIYQRSDKVIKLTPSVANSTASYQLTIYYTTAELAAWGGNVPNLKVMKVTDGANLASTLDQTNAMLYTPVVDDQRGTKGYASFSINATGGFSQFFLVSPTTTIPISLLSFEAQPANRSIVLNWQTANEINNKGYVIERSMNGTQFERIGWVDGHGTSTVSSNYRYVDLFVQPNVTYYYRLRQTDLDNRETLSETRQARLNNANTVELMVSPNPARSSVRVFIPGQSGTTIIQLLNTLGQQVRSWNNIATSIPAVLPLEGLSKGVYMINVLLPGGIVSEKLIIQ